MRLVNRTVDETSLAERTAVGLSDRESSAILDVLVAQLERPQIQVRARWEPQSVAFWDNRVTAHLGPVELATPDV